MSTEQAIAIFESGAETVARTQPDPEPTNYWWTLLLVTIPPLLGLIGIWLTRKYGKGHHAS